MDKKAIILLGGILALIMLLPGEKEAESNLVINADFSMPEDCGQCSSWDGECFCGWDMRPGQGVDGNPVGEVDYTVFHTSAPSLKIVPSTPENTGECDRTVWQNPRQDVSYLQGQTVEVSAWVRHSDCTVDCGGVYPQYTGTMLTNWDCCAYEGVCTNPQHFQGLWCGISGRGGVRLGMDFYDGSMFKEYVVTDDYVTADNQWHHLTFTAEVPQNYYAPTGEGPFSATQAIIWVQAFPCESDATIWMDDVSLSVAGSSSAYDDFLDDVNLYIYGTDSFLMFINNGNNWVSQ